MPDTESSTSGGVLKQRNFRHIPKWSHASLRSIFILNIHPCPQHWEVHIVTLVAVTYSEHVCGLIRLAALRQRSLSPLL